MSFYANIFKPLNSNRFKLSIMEKINSTSFLRMALFGLAFLFSLAFYSPTFGQCTNGSGFGAVTAPSTPTPIQITSCSYAGEYATVTSCPAGASFKFNTSNPNDFLTIRQGTSGGAVLGTGTGEVTVTTSVVGNLYMHINTDPSCGTQSSCRSSWVECVSCQAPPPGECLNSISYSSISAPNSPTPVTITTCAYAAEYEWITGAVAGETYTFASSLNDWLTIRHRERQEAQCWVPVRVQSLSRVQFRGTFMYTLIQMKPVARPTPVYVAL